MKPRQNLRDFHHNTPPPTFQPNTYQPPDHSVNLQHQVQSMAPPPPLPASLPTSLGPQATAGQSPQASALPSQLFADLARAGINLEDLNKASINNRPQLRDDILKNLQGMLGKRDTNDLLRKLIPDYQRVIGGLGGSGGGGGSGVGGNRDSVPSLGGTGSISGGGGGGAGGAMSFTNNIIDGNSSQQQEQDVQYANAQQQQQQQHQAAASAINHHQHFRIPTTNTSMHNSPLQQQQLLSQHKSVLSLHHQQQHHPAHHQNDPVHRQRLNQQHKLNSVPNSSMANINDMSGGPSSSISSSSAALLDAQNSSIFNHRTSPAISSYTIPSAGTTPRVPNIMDAIGGQPGLDNMHDTTPFQQTITMNNRDKLKSLAKHQQLQKQFRTTADKHKNLQWPNQSATSANLNLVDSQNQQRIIGGNISNSTNNNTSLSHLQRQITSPLSSAISPPQATPGLPKSLLNLAACSTSPPSAGVANSMTSSNRVASQLSSARNANIANATNIATNNRMTSRINANNAGQRVAQSSTESLNILQQIVAQASNNLKNTNSNTVNRSNYSNFSLSSLLSDDQSSNPKNTNNNNNNNNNNNIRSVVNQNVTSNVKSSQQTSQPVQRRPSSAKSDDLGALQINANPKDAYLAYLQERGSKGGVSIGEITCPTSNHILDQPSQLQSVLMSQHETAEHLEEPRGDIESAISRVEARNDLSLLYPPVSLASNSQKQINALSAGIKLPEEVDLFTDEVKMIVQEGCNIIYECKTCSNLFRSLANLVKHKRLYCKEQSNKTVQLELNRRSSINTIQNTDTSVTKNTRNIVIRSSSNRDPNDSKNSLLADNRPRQPSAISASTGSQKYNLRGKRVDVSCLTGDSRSSRNARNQERQKDNKGPISPSTRSYVDNPNNSSNQTNLSRLLQSQPRQRVTHMKDSALMDALSMGSAMHVGGSSNMVDSSYASKFNQQLVRNSSLAKTLLSENVKSINGNQTEMSNMENSIATNQKAHTGPKRKLLEDCIRKVKRDKLGPSEIGHIDNQDALGSLSQDEPDQYRDPLDIDDSGADSDALIMDIDESYLPQSRRKTPGGRKSPNRSQTRPASSSIDSSSRLNSSSALLKALTRPVEPKPSYTPSISQKAETTDKSKTAITSKPVDSTSSSDVKNLSSTGSQADAIVKPSELQYPEELAAQPRSPILDKYECVACTTEYPDNQSLFEHLISNYHESIKIHPCMLCSLSFITLENACRHLMDAHDRTKTEVSRLKHVVESRSTYSNDFTACTDYPTGRKDISKDKFATNRKPTPDTLSDSAATEQILEDTVASVSMATSPSKSTVFSPSKRLPSLVSRSSSRLAAKRSPSNASQVGCDDRERSQDDVDATTDVPVVSQEIAKSTDVSQDEADDILSDSMIPNITDEHLALLERQEAEIEAERIRKQQENEPIDDTGPPGGYSESDNRVLAGDSLSLDDGSITGKTQPSIDEPSIDGGSIDQDDFINDEDSNHWTSRQAGQDDGEKNVIGDELSSKSDADLPAGTGENEDSQKTQPPVQTAASTGKQVRIDDQQDDAESNDVDMDNIDDEEDAESQDHGSWDRPTTSSASTSGESNSSNSNESDGTDSDCDSNDGNNLHGANVEDDNGAETNDQIGDSEIDGDEDGDVEMDSDSLVRRKRSNSGSARREIDLDPSLEVDDKISRHDYHDNTSSHSSSKVSSKPSSSGNTVDGAGSCKLKLKTTPSSAGREVGGGSSNASNSSSVAASSSGGGGIMKLKIQLKTQPDEKSKVYRIVE